jgi:tRNA A-37 threonylcarbamoyl transferase component Bud32
VAEPVALGPKGRYRLVRRIATGGMGEVWRATDTVLGREVAVKVLKPEYADDPTFRSRFESEARHAAALHHPNIASVFDYGELPAVDGSGVPRPYLVMELVPGKPLSALLREGEPMPAATASDLVAQAADGIAAAHAIGVVHRDVKPGNLLVTPDRQVKITDFGIARATDGATLTQTGQVLGTPAYFSPEQAEGKPATMASDIYSLGVVLYECLAGRRPFVGDTPIGTALAHLREDPPPLPDDVPEHLRNVTEVALAKDPADRFDSAAEFRDAVRGGPLPDPDRTAVVAGGAAAGAAGAAAAEDSTRVMPAAAPATPPPDEEPDRRRGLPPWWPWAAAALAVLVVVVALAALGDPGTDDTVAPPAQEPSPSATEQQPDPEPTSAPPEEEPTSEPPPTPPPTTDPGTIEVVPEDYIGMPKEEAKQELTELGLKVKDEKVENPGDQTEGTVADVEPSGTLEPDDEVTLYWWDKPKPDNEGQGNSNDDEDEE